MTRKLSLLLPIILLTSCYKEIIPGDNGSTDSTGQSPASTSYIYDIQALPDIRLTIPLAEWNRLLSNFDQNPHNQEYIIGHFQFNKQGEISSLDSIGIRLRGNTSRRRPEGHNGQFHNRDNPDWHHVHFGIHFEEYRPGQRFSGTDRMHLKWFKDDAMYVREIYSYDLFHRFGVYTAPRSTYCKLTVHVEGDPEPAYFGVYEMVESVQEQFLTDRLSKGFASDSGFLWKCTWGSDLSFDPDPFGKMGVEQIFLDDALSEEYPYDLKTRQEFLLDAKMQLWRFIKDLNEKEGEAFRQFISERMDIDLFLKTYAVNVMLGMWDDYWVNQNNYYLYLDNDNKVYFIPWDYDNTLGTSMLMTNSGTQPVLEWGTTRGRPLVNKILAIPEYRSKYLSYIEELCDPEKDLFDPVRSMERIRAWHSLVEPWLSNDTGEDMQLLDRPASWGNCSFYRLLSGNEQGGDSGEANWFKTRSTIIPIPDAEQ